MHPRHRPLPCEALDDRSVLWETALELISVRHLKVLKLESRSDRAPDKRIVCRLDDRPDPVAGADDDDESFTDVDAPSQDPDGVTARRVDCMNRQRMTFVEMP